MDQEVSEAPTDHMKVSNAVKESVITAIYNRRAFTIDTAIKVSDLDLFGQEFFALEELVQEDEVIRIEKEGEDYCYLSDEYKPLKSYRKEVVMGLSIPLLLFIVVLILGGLGAIIYAIFAG